MTRTPITSGAAASATPESGIEPEWTLESASDPRRIVRDPDPRSRRGAIRIIGYSPSAEFVITVIATPSDHAGVTAWKTSGADLRAYESQERQ